MLGMVVSLYPRNMTDPPYPPLDYEEVFLCGPAQEVWEYLKNEMVWYREPKTFNPGLASIRSWRRSGAIKLYNMETKREQNTRIRQEIAKEIDKLYNLFEKRDKKACPMVGFEQAFGEFGDFLLDTDIRYYEED